MPATFLSEELHRVPVALYNSWPFINASWIDLVPLFMASHGASFSYFNDREKLDYCNTTLRFHMNRARWYGRWIESPNVDWKFKLYNPPNGVPELCLATSGTFITRALYGEFVCYWNVVYIVLTLAFLILFSTTSFLAITEDPPIFTGYRTIDVDNVDVDKIQIGTRTVRARNLFLFLTNAPPASFFRLTVIYTRYFKGAIVFKVRSCPFIRIGLDHFRPNTLLTGQQRKHSDRVRYTELTDLLGRFDALKFEAWVRRVMLDAMTVPYGSVWNLHHLTLT